MTVIEPLEEPLKPRRGRVQKPARSRGPRRLSKPAVDRMIRGVPEVLVKITSSARSMQRIRSQVTYISRHGRVPIEDEAGNVYLGQESVSDVLYPWENSRHTIPETEAEGTRRETHHVVWSMPVNTDRAAVTQAARATASKLFNGYQYVMATHDDQPQPHVHIVVRTTGIDGRKLNPRKADLQHWRETFAGELLALGIEANATSRVHRGRVERAKNQAVQYIDERLAARGLQSEVTAALESAARDEADGKAVKGWESRGVLEKQRKDLLHTYADQIGDLLSGGADDRALGEALAGFAKELPPVQTAHERRVSELSNRDRGVEAARGPER